MKPASPQHSVQAVQAVQGDGQGRWRHSSFYRFTPVPDARALAATLREEGRRLGLTGSILLAHEGISGAVAGSASAVQGFEAALQHSSVLQGALRGMVFKHSHSDQAPFLRLKVSVKPEIVALGLPLDVSLPAPGAAVGALQPQAWHQLLQREDVVVLDNRNHFEYRLGHFRNAVDPQVHNFRDFVAYVEQQAPAWRAAGRPVAMYCTGGIRCEKAAPWMQSLGLQVYQLEGGVMAYLQQMGSAAQDAAGDRRADAHSAWQGACFVFDNRLALDGQLQPVPISAEHIYDPRHTDEAWRLQRAQRLQPGDVGADPQASPPGSPDGTPSP